MSADQMTECDTPSLILDVAKLDANIARMKKQLDGEQATLRPHVKTCKSVEVVKRLFPETGGVGPITVSTLQEAEYFAAAGYTDILYAVSIVPSKLHRVSTLQESGAKIHLILDDVSVVGPIAEAAHHLGQLFSILVEIDCDGHRAGLPLDQASTAIELARKIERSPMLSFAGIMTHAGESYECNDLDAIRRAAAVEAATIQSIADQIEASGIACPIRSIGSSPTAQLGEELGGITEVRAGVFMFWDLFQANLGVCDVDQIALSVLTTVISHRQDKGWLICDAGGLALSKDRGTAKQAKDYGFGLVCDESGQPLGEYLIDSANQEHGIITNHSGTIDFNRFPIDSRLRILPNHACLTAAAHPGYHAVARSGKMEYWPRTGGW